jgi:uridine kinase
MPGSIRNELEHINGQALQCPEAFVRQSEARYRNIVSNIAGSALAQRSQLILLAGPSASGKTTTARKIAEALAAAGVRAHKISLDDFYYELEDIPLLQGGARDIESVDALDLSLLQQTLRALLETGEGQVPHFSFKAGKRSRWDALRLGPGDVIILEGLHALHPRIAPPGRALKVYISVASRIYNQNRNIVLNKRALRLVRRILRDSQFRATAASETIAMWPSVTQGEETWLTPCKPQADFLVNSIHLYEPCVFGPLVLPLLRAQPMTKQAAQLAAALRRFQALPQRLVPADSLLREFLG